MQLYVLIYTITCVHGFIPPISPIRFIVSAEALASSIIENLYREIPENFIMTSIFKTRFHPELDLFYLALIGLSIYTRYQQLNDPSADRWTSIPMYSKIHKITNTVLLVLMLVFTKNIENAI